MAYELLRWEKKWYKIVLYGDWKIEEMRSKNYQNKWYLPVARRKFNKYLDVEKLNFSYPLSKCTVLKHLQEFNKSLKNF